MAWPVGAFVGTLGTIRFMARNLAFTSPLRSGVLLLLACGLVACQPQGRAPASASAAELDQVMAVCVQQMVKATCTVMNDTGRTPPSGSVVIVAGIGRVDAQAYAELRNAGEAMCQTTRQRCQQDWDGPACRTARQLWAPVSPR